MKNSQLPFCSVLQVDTENFNISYENNMTKSVTLDESCTFDELLKNIEIEFINTIKSIVKSEKSTDLKNDIINKLSSINKNNEQFIIVPVGFKIDLKNVIESEYVSNEIIFGNKTEYDYPGVMCCINTNGSNDVSTDVKFSICQIGFFPEKQYFRIEL